MELRPGHSENGSAMGPALLILLAFLKSGTLNDQKRYELSSQLYGLKSVQSADALLYLGAIHFSHWQLTRAEAEVREVLTIVDSQPKPLRTAQALVLLGSILCERGELARATPVVRRAIYLLERAKAQYEEILLAQTNLAVIYQRQGDYAKAREILERVILLQPDRGAPKAALAEVAMGQSHWNEAAELILLAKQLITDRAGIAGILRIEAQVRVHQGDLAGALDCLQASATIVRSVYGPATIIEIEVLQEAERLLRRLHRSSEARQVRAKVRALVRNR